MDKILSSRDGQLQVCGIVGGVEGDPVAWVQVNDPPLNGFVTGRRPTPLWVRLDVTFHLERRVQGDEVEVPVAMQQDSSSAQSHCSYEKIASLSDEPRAPGLKAKSRRFLPQVLGHGQLMKPIKHGPELVEMPFITRATQDFKPNQPSRCCHVSGDQPRDTLGQFGVGRRTAQERNPH